MPYVSLDANEAGPGFAGESAALARWWQTAPVRSWGAAVLLTAVVAATSVTSGCSSDRPEPTLAPPLEDLGDAGPPAYDPGLEAAAAVLALVPQDATSLSVTDFDQVRLLLGASLLTGQDPSPVRERFWRRAAAQAPLLSEGLLRPVDAELAADYGFTQDDVKWEASFTGPAGEGFVLALRDDLQMAGVERAVEDGVGPLAGAAVDPILRLVTVGTTDDPETSWAVSEEIAAMVGPAAANATYVERDCLDFARTLGTDASTLAAVPADDIAALEPLELFSVTLGGELATVRMGPERADAFERLRLVGNLPATDPELGLGFADGVADPIGGRIGYVMPDAAVAARLVRERKLPFAVCPA